MAWTLTGEVESDLEEWRQDPDDEHLRLDLALDRERLALALEVVRLIAATVDVGDTLEELNQEVQQLDTEAQRELGGGTLFTSDAELSRFETLLRGGASEPGWWNTSALDMDL